jgi:hypothetical protein
MPATEADKLSLQQCGCSVHTEQNRLHVSWADLSREQALAATVIVRSTHRPFISGPALYLALEISPTRALPRYCYFPCNLQDAAQMAYLAGLSATRRLPLNFLGRDFEVLRDHELTLSECNELKESCVKARDALTTLKVPYSFPGVMAEFHNNVRIPVLFERAISEAEFAKALPSFAVDVERLSPEKRALARELVRGFADALRARWGEQLRNAMGAISYLSVIVVIDYGDAAEITSHIHKDHVKTAGLWSRKLYGVVPVNLFRYLLLD